MVSDVLEIYFVEHVKKTEDVDDFLYKIAKYAFENGDRLRCQGIFERIIEYVDSRFL